MTQVKKIHQHLQCYPNCGKGMSTRMVYCVSMSDKNQKYPDELCDESSRPISDKNCFSEKSCPAMWHATQWSQVRRLEPNLYLHWM